MQAMAGLAGALGNSPFTQIAKRGISKVLDLLGLKNGTTSVPRGHRLGGTTIRVALAPKKRKAPRKAKKAGKRKK